MKEGNSPGRRIVIVSNRLPFTIEQENGQTRFKESAGGLATGLKSLLDKMQHGASSVKPEYLWIGWPGGAIGDQQRNEVQSRARAEFRSHAVFLSEEDVEHFYQGFCNKTIWPLFHYFPSHTGYDENTWLQYKKVNEVFAESMLEVIHPDDVLWVHDYHLMLLPNLLRKMFPKIRLGFFLHIPFPQLEIFRLLPAAWRQEILEGLLGADVIGFHTHDYMEYFLRCVQRILGYKHKVGHLRVGQRMVKVGAFPMGVDFKKFESTAKSPEGRKKKEELRKTFGNTKIILSVDRQDYSKGILHRLQGFETMLELTPEWHGKVTLLMIVVPSRIGIQDYEGMKKQIEELVGRINGKFGAIDWVPIIYHYRSVPFDTLVALYAMSDVALVTPLRDGMNLVAKEYIASRTDKTGVLILSEMAGAAKELAEAIIINPNHRQEIAEALKLALEMPCKEQIRRNRAMQKRLRRFDVSHWALSFIRELGSAAPAAARLYSRPLSRSAKAALVRHYDRSARRLLLFDYDGTLVPFFSHPQHAKPTGELSALLRSLGADPKNELVVLSGRDKATLQAWLGSLPIGLVAEHGAWIKEAKAPWQMIKPLGADWKAKLLPILKTYADRVRGAFVEEKEFSLVWHYRNADPERGSLAARELTDDLLSFTANIEVQVLQGNKAVEVKNAAINKGIAAQRWLAKGGFDFILAIGDDRTDEDMFEVLPDKAYSVRVGTTPTQARFQLQQTDEVLRLLQTLAGRGEPGEIFQTIAAAPTYH
ncbi:MAG TPA: bifunctional alpha,alpha-trehalose-phosphate synthase (UDP-forming)/trehalose-phosphatase [Candidatus Binatia bacterium]